MLIISVIINDMETCDDYYSLQFSFITSKCLKRQNERRHGRNGTLRTVHTCIHTHTHIHASARIRTYTHQCRMTLVVDLQDKYYSEKLDYRYRPPPNANSCASADRPDLTNTHVTCVRARLKNFRGYHPNPLLLLQSFPFLFCATKPRYLTNFQYISTTRNDVARYGGYQASHRLLQKSTSPYNAR